MDPRWKKIYPNAYVIKDQGPAGKVSIFLLVGTERALLIDSGYGLLDLPFLIREITDKPVVLVNTHGHLDHANGSWQFSSAYLRSEDVEIYRRHSDRKSLRELFSNKVYRHQQIESRLQAMLAADPAEVLLMDSVQVIDLGDRKITVLQMPGHTRGSVCLLDEKNCAAFTGDNLSRSIWLSLPESISVAEYKGVLERLLPLMQDKQIIWNYPAHGPVRSRVQDDIRRFILCCEAILKKSKKPHFLDCGVTSGLFLGKAGRYILYPKE